MKTVFARRPNLNSAKPCWGLSFFAVAMCLLMADVARAQRADGRGRAYIQRNSGALDLLRSESILAELEIVDFQLEELKALGKEFQQEQRDFMLDTRQQMREMNEQERRERYKSMNDEMTAMKNKYTKTILGKLLPHQSARFKQLLFQSQMQIKGTGKMGDKLSKELQLSDEQKEQLKEKREEVLKKLSQEIKKLRDEASEKIFSSVLTSEQMSKYKELIGEAFKFPGSDDRGGLSSSAKSDSAKPQSATE